MTIRIEAKRSFPRSAPLQLKDETPVYIQQAGLEKPRTVSALFWTGPGNIELRDLAAKAVTSKEAFHALLDRSDSDPDDPQIEYLIRNLVCQKG